MFIVKKFALKKTRLHSDDGIIERAYIEKGGVYYQINNGTIGKGRRTYNMSERAMKELLESTPSNWTKNGYIELKPDTSNVVQLRPKVEPDYDSDSAEQYTYEDIPF